MPNPLDPQGINAATGDTRYSRARRIDMLSRGAAADGSTDDWAIFNQARTDAGANGTVYFPAKPGASTTTYFFATGTAGANPVLSGSQIDADPGVTISVNGSDYVSYRSLKLLNPVTVLVRNRSSSSLLPANIGGASALPAALSLVTPTNIADEMTISTLDFTTWAKRNYNPAAGQSGYTTGSSTTTQRLVTFTGTETSGTYEGVAYTSWRVGDEVKVVVKSSADNASAEAAIIITASGEYVMAVLPSTGAAHPDKMKYVRKRKTGTAAVAVEKKVNLPDASYGPQAAAWPQLAARMITATRVEIVLNGYVIDTVTMGNPIEDVAFTVDAPFLSARVTMLDPILRRRPSRGGGGRTLNLATIGDSLTEAEGGALGWVDALISLLRGQPGISDVKLTNLAHSGDTASATNTIVQANSFATYDAVLCMTGTNDINAQTAQSAFETTLGNIAAKIVADGSAPIFGLPPMYLYEPAGTASPVRPNYGKGGPIRASVEWFCASNGYGLADVQQAVGAVGIFTYPSTGVDAASMWDGLHFTPLGAIAAARAFARAVVRQRTSPQASLLGAERMDGTVHIDYGTAAPTGGSWQVGDRRYNTAPTASGALGWVCTTAGTPGTWKAFGGISA